MNLLLQRTVFGEHYTAGILLIDGKYYCDTLEPAIDDRKPIHIGHPAVPCGTYELAITYSERLKRRLPLLMDVPGRLGIRIHPFNRASESLGCIGFGDALSAIPECSVLGRSRNAVLKFMQLLEPALVISKVFLVIENKFKPYA